MHPLEKAAITIRRSPVIRNIGPLWSIIRPCYQRLLKQFAKTGLERTINGTDSIVVLPSLYNLAETYEPDVWRLVMQEVQVGDLVADVGAYIGFYTVALAKRVGPTGLVYAFEPDPNTAEVLQRHVYMNGVSSHVKVFRNVVGDHDGQISFESGRESESHVVLVPIAGQEMVPVVTLNTIFAGRKLGVLKIDVEGFEENVLRGGTDLLQDQERAPRAIFIEVHPFAWDRFGISSQSLLGLLRSCNYEVFDLQGNIIYDISRYGEVVARRNSQSHANIWQ